MAVFAHPRVLTAMQDKALENRFMDIARACLRSGEPRFTRFLEPPELPLARRAAIATSGVSVHTFGGYGDAERCVAGFTAGGEIEEWEWPIAVIRGEWNKKYHQPEHKDVLGALMAQGVERQMLGDIQFGGDACYLFVMADIAQYLLANFDSAGRAKLKLSEVQLSEVQLSPPKGTSYRVTVASMRLDAIIQEGYKLSRSEAQALVQRGFVKLNHLETLKPDARVCEGDVVSVRGHGRLKVTQEQGETKKGRYGVVLFSYGTQ